MPEDLFSVHDIWAAPVELCTSLGWLLELWLDVHYLYYVLFVYGGWALYKYTVSLMTSEEKSAGSAVPEGPEFLLNAELNLHPAKKFKYSVILTDQDLTCSAIEPGHSSSTVNLADVVGCECKHSLINENDQSAYLTIYAYPTRKRFAAAKSRRREPLTLAFDSNTSYSKNAETAEKWRVAISAALQSNNKGTVAESDKSMLVLINPFSGPGKALQIFEQTVAPVLSEAGIIYTTIITEYAGHATEITQKLKLDKCAGILICSGDGLIFEVIQGLMAHANYHDAIKLPLGVLPGGSGNALSVCVNYFSGEPWHTNFALHSSFIIAKHHIEPLDLVAIDTVDKRLYSFLSLTWGLVADSDIESEKYRSIGNARFTVGVLTRVMGLRKYPGRLSFLPIGDYKPKQTSASKRCKTVHRSRVVSEGSIVSQGSLQGTSDTPSSNVQLIKYRNHSESSLLEYGRSISHTEQQSQEKQTAAEDWEKCEDDEIQHDISTVDEAEDELISITASCSEEDLKMLSDHRDDCNPGHCTSGTDKTCNNNAPETSILPPLDQPLPDDWIVIEDDFVMVTGVFQRFLGPELLLSMESKMADGIIDLQFVRSEAGRPEMLSILLSIENGTHINHPVLEHVKVRAFRLEPLTDVGNLVVDGEQVTYGPVQAQVLPSAARIMVNS